MSKIPDLLENERPRERFARLGSSAVSDAELIAIFFRVGVKGSSAIEIGRTLLKKYGSLTSLGGLTVKELSQEHGLGTAKAAQLLAAFELGARCANEKMSRKPMNSAESIYEAMAPRLAHELKEHVLILLLDSKLRCTRTIELSVGNANAALCEPRDILHHVLINRATAFALVHNHPSGDPRPSKQDEILTRNTAKVSSMLHIRFVDHIIIGRLSDELRQPYYSFMSNGQI